VRPWVVDDFPAAFPDWQCQVAALSLATLASDYAQLRAMCIAAPPEPEVVMARLAEAERTLNASGAA
jgi:hypothetical protein